MSRVILIDSVVRIMNLQDGWGEYQQGIAPDLDAIRNAWLLADFLYDARIYAVLEGGVQVEWNEGDGDHVVTFYNKPKDLTKGGL